MDEGTYQRMAALAFKALEDENKALRACIDTLKAQSLNTLGHTIAMASELYNALSAKRMNTRKTPARLLTNAKTAKNKCLYYSSSHSSSMVVALVTRKPS